MVCRHLVTTKYQPSTLAPTPAAAQIKCKQANGWNGWPGEPRAGWNYSHSLTGCAVLSERFYSFGDNVTDLYPGEADGGHALAAGSAESCQLPAPVGYSTLLHSTHYLAESLSWYSLDREKHSCTPLSTHSRFIPASSSSENGSVSSIRLTTSITCRVLQCSTVENRQLN